MQNPKYYDDSPAPYCNDEKCGEFDGKRCRILGHRPGTLCLPTITDAHQKCARHSFDAEVFRWGGPDPKNPQKVLRCTARFHGWGVDFVEFEEGPGNFSVAIVEFADGTVEGVPLDLFKFSKGDEG